MIAQVQRQGVNGVAMALYEKMRADLPHLSNGERLDSHLARLSNLSLDQSMVVLDEYIRFLALAATGPDMAVPSPLIDAVWHKHIEDTRAYQDYCAKVIGRFVHHMPNIAHLGVHLGYQKTLENYWPAFCQYPDPRIWPTVERLDKFQKNKFLAGLAWILGVFGALLTITGDYSIAKVVGFAVFVAAVMMLVYVAYSSRGGPWRFGIRSGSSCTSITFGGDGVGDGGHGGSGCGGGD
jgi:hypothetical protein